LPDAEFRDGQEEAIRAVVEGPGRSLVVQKTGWGKSFVYFIAIKLLREAGRGPALLISPLLALMRNQIAAAERMGVRARTIHSENRDDWDEVERAVARDGVDVLLISPERLANERFRTEVLDRIAGGLSLLVIDEAHCISDWGHDFRPHYRILERIAGSLPASLRLRTQAERLAWLAGNVPSLPGSGIVYTLTVRDAGQVADWLRSRGLDVEAYTGETGDRRAELEQALLDNRVKALVATTALGMGFDKPDLAFVIHYQAPGSVVAYYQQVGRAGRALDAAYGVLLSGEEETDITDFFIDTAFPTRPQVEAVLAALEAAPGGLSVPQLLAHVNVGQGRVEKTLELLSLESPAPIAKQGAKWQLTAARLSESFWERAERLTRLRRQEQRQMQEYVDLPAGHMEFLIRALDGEPGDGSGPDLPPLPATPDPELVKEAIAFLKRTRLPIEPRRRWPPGGLPHFGLTGNISEGLRAEPGKALCLWGDAGWGTLVRRGKYEDGRFGDDLVDACVELIEEWQPDPAPTWVTCVPSRRHPDLVPDFAGRLAGALGLPFEPVLVKTDDRPEQKRMANSTQQARNVDGSLGLAAGELPGEPVLLVDDLVDSRWTLTVSAWLLRSNGCGKVWPLVLAQAGAGS
jgi:ATP-dependent DNA helicase RecQ